MLENWLRPIGKELAAQLNLDSAHCGTKMMRYEEGLPLPSLKDVQVALVGVGGEEADLVRKVLYGLSFPFGKLQVADLGNTRKDDSSFVIPLLQELIEGKICPIIIGSNAKIAQAQFKAHYSCQPSVNLCVIDNKIPYHPRLSEVDGHYLNPIIDGKTQPFHFSVIGCQSHFVDEESFAALAAKNADCVRLGKAKANLQETEPFIRDADLACFHLRALKRAEAPASNGASPSGFFCEEACQLARYAGMSDKLTSISFVGFDQQSLEDGGQTAQVLAQLVWYFLDGFGARKNDFPASMDDLVEYIVDLKGHDYQLTFWKSNKTGRWWLQVPTKTKKKLLRHRLIPCSYNDYLQTTSAEIPDRLLNALSRFG